MIVNYTGKELVTIDGVILPVVGDTRLLYSFEQVEVLDGISCFVEEVLGIEGEPPSTGDRYSVRSDVWAYLCARGRRDVLRVAEKHPGAVCGNGETLFVS